MSREIVAAQQKKISLGIVRLRKDLGFSQDRMARELGCTVSAYQQWEQGRRLPGGEWLLRLLQMCPDRESLKAFGLQVPEDGKNDARKILNVEAEMGKGPSGMTDPELREWHKNIQDVVRYLGQQKRAGNKVAAEMLRSMAQSVVRAAGLATEPGISKARRAKMIEAEIKRLERII